MATEEDAHNEPKTGKDDYDTSEEPNQQRRSQGQGEQTQERESDLPKAGSTRTDSKEGNGHHSRSNTREASLEGSGERGESRRRTNAKPHQGKPQKDEEGTETEHQTDELRKRSRTDPQATRRPAGREDQGWTRSMRGAAGDRCRDAR